ncbi:MAG TPA: hypothetical protein VE990_09440 [Acidimicrobiales bacterium]|nr:hypothetical protein [Acidimicrobiales bacterium]
MGCFLKGLSERPPNDQRSALLRLSEGLGTRVEPDAAGERDALFARLGVVVPPPVSAQLPALAPAGAE